MFTQFRASLPIIGLNPVHVHNLLCRPVHSAAQTAQINIKELLVAGDNVVACACINPAAAARVTLSRQKLENAFNSRTAAESVLEEEKEERRATSLVLIWLARFFPASFTGEFIAGNSDRETTAAAT